MHRSTTTATALRTCRTGWQDAVMPSLLTGLDDLHHENVSQADLTQVIQWSCVQRCARQRHADVEGSLHHACTAHPVR